ncbi:MAG: hypothetical protein QOF33_4231 [Thermomicrobiales bacterium]|jgi:hypothetical protein|nr:hypothetical protein [Thermomicrobiales bacterium]
MAQSRTTDPNRRRAPIAIAGFDGSLISTAWTVDEAGQQVTVECNLLLRGRAHVADGGAGHPEFLCPVTGGA